MSVSNSQYCHFQFGLIPVCLAYWLMLMPCGVDAGVITSGCRVTSVDLLCGNVSSLELEGWDLANAAVVKSARGCLFVDLAALDSSFGTRISGMLMVVGYQGQPFLFNASSASPSGGGGNVVVAMFFCGRQIGLFSPSARDWARAMKLESLLAVPPEEMLKPPRNEIADDHTDFLASRLTCGVELVWL